EPASGVLVSFHVSRDLGVPVVDVGPGLGAVLGTAVPEAAVDEDGHAGLPKHQVSTTVEVSDRSCVDSIAKTRSVDEPTHGHLRLRVPPAVALHGGTAPW